MKQLPAILILCIFLCGCSNKDKKDSAVLSEKQMTDVMWDLMRVDQYVQDIVLKDTSKKMNEERERRYEEVFRFHHITIEQFKKSKDWYQANPVRFQPIIDSIVKKQVVEKPQFTPIGADTFQHVRPPRPVKSEQ